MGVAVALERSGCEGVSGPSGGAQSVSQTNRRATVSHPCVAHLPSSRFHFCPPLPSPQSVPGNLPAELSAWSSWKVRHGRSYGSADEDAFRFGLFQKTLARIVDNNRRLGGWGNYGLNKFADMDPAEWANMYLSRNVRSERKEEMMRGVPVAQPERVGSIPKDVDWRQKNAVTWVKDQGERGTHAQEGARKKIMSERS